VTKRENKCEKRGAQLCLTHSVPAQGRSVFFNSSPDMQQKSRLPAKKLSWAAYCLYQIRCVYGLVGKPKYPRKSPSTWPYHFP